MNLRKLPSLYHVSPSLFETPIISDDVPAGKHLNGLLGLWISPFPESCRSFGPNVYDVILKKKRRDHIMPLWWFKDLDSYITKEQMPRDKERELYVDFRERFRRHSDVIWVKDQTGKPGEIIVLNLAVIDHFALSAYTLRARDTAKNGMLHKDKRLAAGAVV